MSILEILIPLRLDDPVKILVHSAHFLLRAELFQNFREVGRIILIVHLSRHLKYDELIYTAMDLRAPLNLQITAHSTIFQDGSAELLNKIVGLIHCLFILNFAVFQLHQVVHHVVIDLLPCNICQFSFILNLLILDNAVFGFTRRLEVRHRCLFYARVDRMQLVLPLL